MADAAAGAVEAPEAAVTTMEVAVEFCEEQPRGGPGCEE